MTRQLPTGDFVKNARWRKYGLCVSPSIRGNKFSNAVDRHDLVVDYLERHPETASLYLSDCPVYLYDVLDMAEKDQEARYLGT